MSSAQTHELQIAPAASEDFRRLLLRLEGELDLSTGALLRAWLRKLDRQPLVLDLGGLTYTDWSGLAILLEERTRSVQNGAPLRIRGATGQTRDLLKRAGVLELLGDPSRVH